MSSNPIFNKANGKSFRAYSGEDGPYQYDAIGNLIADETEGVKISWTPYGKVREVKTKNDSITVSYRYDAAGNRIEKRISSLSSGEGRGEVTHYLRDASGNVMAIYKTPLSGGEGAGGEALIEQPLYGSSRLGLYKGGRKEGQRVLGKKNYELTSHLGNVLSVITDNAGMKPDSVWATVVSATDYYPFGLAMKGRTFSDTTYRYGFNGKEKDGMGDQVYDYGFRIYNPRIAKFLSVDPLTNGYPELTPYQFASNTPIAAIDLDGLEAKVTVTGNYWKGLIKEAITNKDIERATWLAFDAARTTLDKLKGQDAKNWALDKGGWKDNRPASYSWNKNNPQGLTVVFDDVNEPVIEIQGQVQEKTWYGKVWDSFLKAIDIDIKGGLTMYNYKAGGATGPIYQIRKGRSYGSIDIGPLMDAMAPLLK
jgi:RHS repeat-associated protein